MEVEYARMAVLSDFVEVVGDQVDSLIARSRNFVKTVRTRDGGVVERARGAVCSGRKNWYAFVRAISRAQVKIWRQWACRVE